MGTALPVCFFKSDITVPSPLAECKEIVGQSQCSCVMRHRDIALDDSRVLPANSTVKHVFQTLIFFKIVFLCAREMHVIKFQQKQKFVSL